MLHKQKYRVMPKKFIPLNLPEKTVENLRRLKIAYSFSSGKFPSYAYLIDLMIDSLEKTNPGLYNTFRSVNDPSADKL